MLKRNALVKQTILNQGNRIYETPYQQILFFQKQGKVSILKLLQTVEVSMMPA
jgi:hypothetical protein